MFMLPLVIKRLPSMGYYCLENTLGHFVVLIPQSLLIDKPDNINWESYARGAVYAV